MQEYIIDEGSVGLRLDVYVVEKNADITRSNIKHKIEEGVILVNGKTVKAGYSLKVGDKITIGDIELKPMEAKPEDIDIDIVYEDSDIAIINKPQGMVVHPAVGNVDGTLVNALLYRLDNLSGINGVLRPGIVHRIDKDTSGLLVVAKNDYAHSHLSQEISTKECRRIYYALVQGKVKSDTGEIITHIGRDKKNRLRMAVVSDSEGKVAHTMYKVLEWYKGYTLMEFELKTGRTHQIRVHSKHIGHPIVGDKLYNPNKCKFSYIDGQLLHAKRLILTHPRTKETLEFEVELPEYFRKVLDTLEKE